MCARLGSVLLFTLLIGSATASNAVAQGLTGQISGTVVDSSRGVLPGAAVAVQNVNTQVKRDVVSDETGAFVITDLLAGTYTVSVTMSGFKTYQQTDVALSANERLALRTIVLEVGQLEETIAVTAESARVQTTSGERSGLITQQQLQDISLKGKDYMGMLRLLPGVIDTQNREAPGWNNLGGLSINGGRNNTINLTYDGVTNLDTGSNTGPFLAPGLDSIAEIKVLTSNYQAEYGRSSGGTINVVTKSGTPGLPRRRLLLRSVTSALNANEWQNNKFDRAKPPYKFDYSGYNVGGPIVLPELQQRAQQAVLLLEPGVPAAHQSGYADPPDRCRPRLERRGDFSQSIGTNGQLIVVRDPTTGQPFPGNVIPANRIDRNGQALLNLFPTPNFSDPTARRTTPSRARSINRATIRCCAWTGTSAPNTLLLLASQLRLRGVQGRLGFRPQQRQLAAAADRLRDPQLRHRQHGPAHVQSRRRSWRSPSD